MVAGDERGPVVFVAYTSSRPWTGAKKAGVYAFDRSNAARMGHSRAFVLDLRRLAALPFGREWFPDFDRADHGIIGRAPDRLRADLEAAMIELFRRRPEVMERLGPRWPGSRG